MDNKIKWITMNGNHIPIKEGQSKEEAVNAFLKSKSNPRESSVKELKVKQEILIDDIPHVEYAYGFSEKDRKNTKHHIAHAKEMGFKNQDEYEKAACDFFNGNSGTLYYSKRRERFYRYDKKTQRMVASSKGFIHTFMKVSLKKFEVKKKEDGLWEI